MGAVKYDDFSAHFGLHHNSDSLTFECTGPLPLNTDGIRLVCKYPELLTSAIHRENRVLSVGQLLLCSSDEASCQSLCRKLLEILCISATKEQSTAILQFLHAATILSADICASMDHWVVEFYPAINMLVKPVFISHLPFLVSNVSIVEDALVANIVDNRADLIESSLTALISLNSKRLANVFFSNEINHLKPSILGALLAKASDQEVIDRLLDIYFSQLNALLPLNDTPSTVKASKRSRTHIDQCEWIDNISSFVKAIPSNLALQRLSSYKTASIGYNLALFISIASNHDVSSSSKLLDKVVHFEHSIFETLLPVLLGRLEWLDKDSVATLLLQCFSKAISTAQSEWCLRIARLFFKGLLGETSKRAFVNNLACCIIQAGNAGEKVVIDIGIEIMESCAREYPSSRYSHHAALKLMIDGIHDWSLDILRKYYRLYAELAVGSDSVMNELILLLKKQMFSQDPAFRQMGALGIGQFISAVAKAAKLMDEPEIDQENEDFLHSIASCSQRPPTKRDYSMSQQAPLASGHLKIAISILEEASKGLRTDVQAFSIFLSELDLAFGTLHSVVQEWINEWVTCVFQHSFIVEATGSSNLYDLDNGENPICLDFSGAWHKIQTREMEPAIMSTCHQLFRLMQTADRIVSGNDRLQAIDALQGCPVILNADLAPECKFILQFNMCNLFRQIFIAFSSIREDEAVFQKNHGRLMNIVSMMDQFRESIAGREHLYQLISLDPHRKLVVASSLLDERDDDEVEDLSFFSSISEELTSKSRLLPLNTKEIASAQKLLPVNMNNLAKALIPLAVPSLSDYWHRALDSEKDQLSSFILGEISGSDASGNFNLLLDLWDSSAFGLSYLKTLDAVESALAASSTVLQARLQNYLGDGQFEAVSIDVKLAISRLCQKCAIILPFSAISQIVLDILEGRVHVELKASGFVNLLDIFLLQADLQDCVDKFFSSPIDLKPPALLLFRQLLKHFGRQIQAISDVSDANLLLGLFGQLINCARARGKSDALSLIIKEGRLVLDSLSRSSLLNGLIPILKNDEGESQESRGQVLKFIKTLQQGTRSLQVISTHMKYERFALPQSIPSAVGASKTAAHSIAALKRSLEVVIFRIKEIASAAEGAASFWVGNLKHRDLDGQELCSQVELVKIDPSEDESSDTASVASSSALSDQPSDDEIHSEQDSLDGLLSAKVD